MAERRQGPFPVHGDQVVDELGRTWLFVCSPCSNCNGDGFSSAPEICQVCRGSGYHNDGSWEQLDVPGLSREETERAAEHERDVRARLLLAMNVWARASEACPWQRVHGPDVRISDPLPTFAALLARAILTDCIAETCDGRPVGTTRLVTQQIAGMFAPSQCQRILNMLRRHQLAEHASRKLPSQR